MTFVHNLILATKNPKIFKSELIIQMAREEEYAQAYTRFKEAFFVRTSLLKIRQQQIEEYKHLSETPDEWVIEVKLYEYSRFCSNSL